jgi:hypothetical protein
METSKIEHIGDNVRMVKSFRPPLEAEMQGLQVALSHKNKLGA